MRKRTPASTDPPVPEQSPAELERALYLDLAGLVLVTGFVGWEYVMTRKERSRSADIA